MYNCIYSNEYCGFIDRVGISFCGCINIQFQGYINSWKIIISEQKLSAIMDICDLTEQKSPQKIALE